MCASSEWAYSDGQCLDDTLELLVVYILLAFLKLRNNLLHAVFFWTVYTVVF